MKNAIELTVHNSNRWHRALPVRRCVNADAQRDADLGKHIAGGFTHTATPIPAFDDTRFHVCTDGADLLITLNLPNDMGPVGADQSVEIFIDPFHDHVGFFQLILQHGKEPLFMHHMPYPEAQSTSFKWLKIKECVWDDQSTLNVVAAAVVDRWVHLRLSVDEVFRAGNICGFNVARSRTAFRENSSWNLASGIGFVDATSFGHLYIGAEPTEVRLESAMLDGDRLTLEGTAPAGALTLELADPHDGRTQVKTKRSGRRWRATARVDRALHGRCRIYPRMGRRVIEPEFFAVDVPMNLTGKKNKPFALGMFYDIPDDLRCNHFTPARLQSQIEQLSDWGINRLYWIDYGPTNKDRAVWESVCDIKNARKTHAACGDVLGLAAKLSRKLGVEFFGTFKIFDMGFTMPTYEKPAVDHVLEVESKYSPVLESVGENQHLTMQSNPAWTPAFKPPVTRLLLRSNEPIAPLRAGDLAIWVSGDNKKYRPYRGPMTLKQMKISEPHCKWTPAGRVVEKGSRPQWVIELAGLKINEPFMAIGRAGEQTGRRAKDLRVINRAFLLAEAFDSAGRSLTPILADAGTLAGGFTFGKSWPGWANQTEKMLDFVTWAGGTGAPLAMAIKTQTVVPQMLEPIYPETQKVWLGYVQRLIDAGVDGVDLRILCHHVCAPSWLNFAYAPGVREAFKREHGREPEATEADYTLIRLMRGKAITQLLRDARRLTKKAGKKLAVHLEPGVEVSPNLHTRMALHLDWRTWMNERLVDELTGKYWCSQNRFIHQEVLPLARKQGIAVHLCDMNFTLGSPWGVQRAARLAVESRDAGFDGFAYYETVAYMRMNKYGVSLPISHADHAVRRAADALAGKAGI